MATKVEELKDALSGVLKEAKDLADGAKARDDNPDGLFDGDETAKAEAIREKAVDLKKQLDEAQGKAALRSEIDKLGELIGTGKSTDDEPVITEDDVERWNKSGKRPPAPRQASLGSQFVESEWFKDLAGQANGNPDAFKNTHVESPKVGMKVNPFTTGVATQGAPLMAPDQRGLSDYGPFQRPMTLRDLVTVGRTTAQAVRYARITGFTNAATGVHEATTVTGTNAAGGLKPQSDLAVEEKIANVVTIAHWFAASKQALSDIPYLQTLIDSFGMYGLQEEEEDQMIAGTGSANDQLDGFNTVSGMQTQTFSVNIFQSIRKGMTKIRKIGRARPTGVLVNLEDDELMDLFRTDGGGGAGTGPWAGNGPWQLGPPTVWGLPRVASEACPTGKAYVADFRTIVLLIREDANMRVTDSHADYFVRNLMALLFEERATQLVIRPKAIVEVATA